MKAVAIPLLAIALTPLGALASAAEPSAPTIAPNSGVTVRTEARNWGPRHEGRWIYGWRAPSGWAGYCPAARGWVLPGYWAAPRYYIGDYTRYGWSAPPQGYGWSRYYDDAVLTDANGVVQESHRNVDWDRYDAHMETLPPRDSDDEMVVGGVSERRSERFRDERRRRHAGPDEAYAGRWSGTWRGSHDGGPETVYQGSFDGAYRGSVPHWRQRGGRDYGYGEVETRTTYQPVTTTTTTETEEWAPADSE